MVIFDVYEDLKVIIDELIIISISKNMCEFVLQKLIHTTAVTTATTEARAAATIIKAAAAPENATKTITAN